MTPIKISDGIVLAAATFVVVALIEMSFVNDPTGLPMWDPAGMLATIADLFGMGRGAAWIVAACCLVLVVFYGMVTLEGRALASRPNLPEAIAHRFATAIVALFLLLVHLSSLWNGNSNLDTNEA